jgi:outer membrane protein TolC
LMLDERRANLQKARQSAVLNASERAVVLNDVWYSATQTYWKWAFYVENNRILREALRLADVRFAATKIAFAQGDRMAMDTLESFIQVQDRQTLLNEANLDVQEAQLKLTNFLWNNQAKPSAFSGNLVPFFDKNSLYTEGSFNRVTLLETIEETHPALGIYRAKLAQLSVEKRWKQEKLKPKLNLNYNILSNALAFNSLFTDNYKWGVAFSTSTLFRAERGDVALTKIKLENTELLREQKALELKNKLRLAFNEFDNALIQLDLCTKTVANYSQLLALENNRFQLGESSLFLLNNREMKLIEAQIKLAKCQMNLQIARSSIDWAAGRLN